MNTFLQRLQEDRNIDVQFWKKHPELRAQLVDDAYPDEAHFVYELLQNAEDAQATTVEFELFDSRLVLKHNGERLFTERDVEAITDVSKTGKGDGRDTIGRFGIGFKSVFKYTESPKIYSGDFNFEIIDFVFPREIPPLAEQKNRTIFAFPFDSLKKQAVVAHAEIMAGLEQLSETTLLYLRGVQCIRWKIGDRIGEVLRYEHSDEHIEVLRQSGNSETSSSHWLRFLAPINRLDEFDYKADGIERQKLSVAFQLGFVGDQNNFNSKKGLAKQFKVITDSIGKVAVFFPAEKETSGLRFHLHAPFAPDLSRASVKETDENRLLFGQLATLAAKSLYRIKELGLLTSDFLAVLPHKDDHLLPRYQGIRAAIIEEMREYDLTPTHARGFAPAKRLLQSGALIKTLIGDNELSLVLGRDDFPQWAINANQRSTDQDKVLASLGMIVWDISDFIEFLSENITVSKYAWKNKFNPTVADWLEGKTFEWLQRLYAALYRHCGDDDDSYLSLHEANIVRLVNGKLTTAAKAYFSTGDASENDPFPRVDERILTTGNQKTYQSDARKFLEQLGVRFPGEGEEISLILQERYARLSAFPPDKLHIDDLRRFAAFLERNPNERIRFTNSFLFRLEDGRKGTGASVYLDLPFKKTGLAAYYSQFPSNDRKKWQLNPLYADCGIEVSRLVSFCENVGCNSDFSAMIVTANCSENLKWGDYLCHAPGSRQTSTSINDDFALDKQVLKLLALKNEALSRLVWSAMCRNGNKFLKARFQWNQAGGYREADSQLVGTLRNLEWVPQKDGRFVRPKAASRNEMLDGFPVDGSFRWLELVEYGTDERSHSAETAVRAAKRAELGFQSEEDLQRAHAFLELFSKDEQERLISEHNARKHIDDEPFPEYPIRNKELRAQRVQDEALAVPIKQTETRSRTVELNYDQVKDAARVYLRAHYTKPSGTMVCQVCKVALPFRLATGAYYFEAVEVSGHLAKRYSQSFLSLCPNDAAKFRHANGSKESILELILNVSGLEVELSLAGQLTTIQFTEVHLADLQACIRSEEDDFDEGKLQQNAGS